MNDDRRSPDASARAGTDPTPSPSAPSAPAPPAGPSPQIIRLDPPLYDAAAALCAAALARRAALDPRFPSAPPGAARTILAATLRDRLADPDAAGFALLRDGRPAGVLVTTYRRLPPASSERLYTPLAAAWLPQSLSAVAPDCAPAEVLPPLYAAAASWLAERGFALHFATAAIADAATLTAWRALGFRPQGVFALLPDAARTRLLARPGPVGVTLRPAARGDARAIVALLSESHRFHAHLPGSFFDPDDGDRHYPALVREELRSPTGEPHYVLALDRDRPVGLASGYVERAAPATLAALMRPLPLGYVAEVAVTVSHRRRGIAAALIAALLPWFAERGAAHVGLHYLAANPIASHAWTALGFVPLELRLQGGPDPTTAALPTALPA